MTTSTALMVTIFLCPVISSAIWLLLARPLWSSLDSTTDGSVGIRFWIVFAALMLYIIPLLTGLIIGVGSIPHSGVYPATGTTRVLASILAGIFIALAGIGIQLSKYSRNMASMEVMRSRSQRRDF